MALSFYTNWQNHNSGCNSFFRPPSPLPSPEISSFHEEPTFFDIGINPIFEPTLENSSLEFSGYLPPPVAVTTTGNFITPSPEIQVIQDYTFTYQNPCYNLPCDQFFPVEYTMVKPELPLGLPRLPETYQGGGCCAAALPAWYGSDHAEESSNVQVKKLIVGGGNSGGSLSAQSMAARVRRRKISEKTSELGKLIPGGHKMNTAEMFQAAFKYIKFLQAQIGVLKFITSLPESEEILGDGEMQALVTCTLMQEKLYNAEKCIGPEHLAETPANHY